MKLVKIYSSSGLSLTAWCKENGVSKSDIYPYLKESKVNSEFAHQQWGSINIPKSIMN